MAEALLFNPYFLIGVTLAVIFICAILWFLLPIFINKSLAQNIVIYFALFYAGLLFSDFIVPGRWILMFGIALAVPIVAAMIRTRNKSENGKEKTNQ